MMSGLRDSCLLNFEVAACSSLDPGTLWSAATETVKNLYGHIFQISRPKIFVQAQTVQDKQKPGEYFFDLTS